MRIYINILVMFFFLIFHAFFDVSHSQSIIADISLPSEDFQRITIEQNSFAVYLRQLPLKKPGSDVVNYKGEVFKSGSDTSVAYVVDMNITNRYLEQCMDVLVRLYADFLWQKKQAEELTLPLPGGHWLAWQNWKEGFRPVFRGINLSLIRATQPDSSFQSYRTFLNTVYSESHTQQFYHAYQPVKRMDVNIGDMFIKKGTKGHAVMIVDMAINERGQMIALIGNGDTPACQFFLLNYQTNNPWIPLDFDQETLSLPLRRKMSWDGLRRFSLPKD